MERTLLTVERHEAGWQVSIRGTQLHTHEMKIVAIGMAVDLAKHRHDATGEPTGVRLRLGNFDQVLIGLHG